MHQTFQLLAVIKASIKTSGRCAVPFFALTEIFPIVRGEAVEAGRLPRDICERIRAMCNAEKLLCEYDDLRKTVVFQDAARAGPGYVETTTGFSFAGMA